jgi:integrase
MYGSRDEKESSERSSCNPWETRWKGKSEVFVQSRDVSSDVKGRQSPCSQVDCHQAFCHRTEGGASPLESERKESMSSEPTETKPARPRGTGSVYQRGNTWWIRYSHHGRVYRESTKQTDKSKAEKKLRIRLSQLTTGTFLEPKTEKIRIEELMTDCLREYRVNSRRSIDDAQIRWDKHLKPFLGHLRAVEVSSTKLNEYVDARQKENAANGTINRELALLKRAFHIAYASTPRKVQTIPSFPHLKEAAPRQGFLEYSQYRKLAEACSGELWLRTILEIGHTYGWRLSELTSMRVRQVNLMDRTIRLESSKNDEPREVIMTASIFTLLSACVSGKPADDHVFTREDSTPVKNFRDRWKSICKKAGVPGLLFHDLRRCGARNLRHAGVSESVIMKIGGWKTASVFRRYAIVDKADISNAVLKLQRSQEEQAEIQNGHKDGHNPSIAPTATPGMARTGNA